MLQLKNYINGQLLSPQSGQYFENTTPISGQIYSLIPDSDERDINNAIIAANEAYPLWSNMSNDKRANFLIKIADRIQEKLEPLAVAESKDNGKPLLVAQNIDIPRAQQNFRFFAHAITQFASESHHMQNSAINFTLRQPLGVVAAISPWNLPLYLFTWKIAPALAAGNTVVAKPSEITPMTAYLLSEICIEIGLPAGVLNIVHGFGPKVGQPLVDHSDIKAVSFTGGTKTGQTIAAITAPKFIKTSLELGGKNPNIIFNDCDFEEMIDTTMRSSWANNGQICLCGSRIYIQSGIYEKFKEDFIKRTNKLVVGHPLKSNTDLGALVSKQHYDKVLSYINLAKEEGGTLLAGGNPVELKGDAAEGYYIRPTIFEGLSTTCRTNQEEIFGPVVTIQPFETEEEAISLANSVDYGLACSIWTQDISKAHRLAEKIDTGIAWVNCWMIRDLRTPFGGQKNSGVGREGGFEALKFFTSPKNVCVKYN